MEILKFVNTPTECKIYRCEFDMIVIQCNRITSTVYTFVNRAQGGVLGAGI